MKKFLNFISRSEFYFSIPAENPLLRQRFALFRLFSLIGTLTCLGVATKMFVTVTASCLLPVFIVALGGVLIVNYFVVHKVDNLRWSYLTMLSASVVLLHTVSYTCGGIKTAATLYFGVIILYAYMLLGRKAGRWFTFAISVHIVYLFIISSYTNWTSFDFFKNDELLINEDFLVNALLSFILIAVQGNYLQSNKNEVIRELENQKILLEQKNDALEHQNVLLNNYAHNLEHTNSELRKFASVASHDLKAPLRAIGTLAGFIKDAEGDSLKPESVEYLELVNGRVSRMDQLLNALLEYSTVLENTQELHVVNTGELLSEIAASYIANEKIEFGFEGEFPMLNVNKWLIGKVFFNLIENAVRFNANEEKKVVVRIENKNQHFYFTIKDNGPGVDPKFHEKIFIIFQTLNPRDEIETMGVGLPIAKKIVNFWNGKMFVNTAEGNGFAITFSIPEIIETPMVEY